MAEISPEMFAAAFADALSESDPKAAAKAAKLVTDATGRLDPNDRSANAQVLRNMAKGATDQRRGN